MCVCVCVCVFVCVPCWLGSMVQALRETQRELAIADLKMPRDLEKSQLTKDTVRGNHMLSWAERLRWRDTTRVVSCVGGGH